MDLKKNKFPTTLTPKQLNEIIKKIDLIEIKRSYLIFFPKWLEFLNPLERFLEKLPFGGLYVSVIKKS